MTVLIIEKNVKTILAIQRRFPPETEWIASFSQNEILHLLQTRIFDWIIIRRCFRRRWLDCMKTVAPDSPTLLSKLIILPRLGWRRRLTRFLTNVHKGNFHGID